MPGSSLLPKLPSLRSIAFRGAEMWCSCALDDGPRCAQSHADQSVPCYKRCSWDCSVSPSSLLSGEQPGSSSHPSQSGGIWMAVVALTSSAFLGTPPFSCSENWVLWLSLNTLTELHFRAFISDLWGDKFLLWASTVLSSLIFFFFPNNS